MKKIILIFILLLVFTLAGCEKVPAYNLLGKDPVKGYLIEVNGTTYRSQPETAWRPLPTGFKLVGENQVTPQNDTKSYLYLFNGDLDHIFVMETFSDNRIFREAFGENYYYRDDITLPPFDSSGIDIIEIKGDKFNLPARTVQDEKAVKEFINILINEEEKELFIKDSWPIFKLEFMNSNYPGIGIESEVWANGDQYWICYSGNAFTPVAKELLEQIAGQKLPAASEYIASKQKTAG